MSTSSPKYLANSSWTNIFQNYRFCFFVISAVTLLVFSNVLQNNFILDDQDLIVDWPLTQDLNNLPRFFINYYPPEAQAGIYAPLRTVIFAVQHALWPSNPLGYHFFSLLIHLLAIGIVYRLALVLTRHNGVSFFATLIFAIHPAHVESVASMSGSVDTLGIVFLFFAFFYYLKAIGFPGERTVENQNNRGAIEQKLYAVSLGLSVLAIFCSEAMLALPFLFLFFDALFNDHRGSWRQCFLRNAPYFLIAGIYLLLKKLALGNIVSAGYLFDSFYLTMMVTLKVWVKYLWIMIFPLHLAHDHIISSGIFSFNPTDFDEFAILSQSIFDPYILGALILLGLVVTFAIRSYRQNPLVTFCLGWFYISLLPVSNLIPGSVYFAERYLYAGSFAFVLLLAYTILSVYEFATETKREVLKWLSLGVAITLIIFFAGRTFVRNFDFRDNLSFFESSLRSNPQSAALHGNLASLYSEAGQMDKAFFHFQKALTLKPKVAQYHFSLAEYYMHHNETTPAINELKKAIELNPDFVEGYYNLAGIYAYLEDNSQAKIYLDKSIALYKKQGRILEAGETALYMDQFMSRKQAALNMLMKSVQTDSTSP